MYNNILVPIAPDHDPRTGQALDIARRLSGDGTKITALTVVEDVPGYIATQLPDGYRQRMLGDVEARLKADLGGVAGVKPVVVEGHSARSIVDYADEHEMDLIVIASHRPGISDLFLGSTASWVVRHARCAIHVMR